MYMFVCMFVVLKAVLSSCISLHKHQDEIISKSKVELDPYLINGLLNDILIISAPELYKSTEYYLYKPTGEFTKLDIPRKNTERHFLSNILITYTKNLKIISDRNKYRVYNIYSRLNSLYGNQNKSVDVVKEQEESMGVNEFMIGPLLPEDHGNWVLSAYVMDLDGQYIEIFQVITIEITEIIGLNTGERATITKGDTLHLNFIYPITNLQTCQLVAPSTTFDRLFDRSPVNMNHCGFVVENMSEADSGVWKIIAVGKMVYRGETFISVSNKNKKPKRKLLIENKESNGRIVLSENKEPIQRKVLSENKETNRSKVYSEKEVFNNLSFDKTDVEL